MNDKVKIIVLVSFVVISLGLVIADIATATERSGIGIIKDSDYDQAYTTISCDSKGRNCRTTFHEEHCKIYVVGDGFESWFPVNCHIYFTQLHLNENINVRWSKGGVLG